MLNSPSDKGGFENMNRIIAVSCVKRGGSSFPVYFFGGILDRVKGCVVTDVWLRFARRQAMDRRGRKELRGGAHHVF